MLIFPDSLQAWGTDRFRSVLKRELEVVDAAQLPLQQGLSQSSHVSESRFSVMVLDHREREGYIFAKAGIFYSGIIAGCSCADDPTPVDEISEYCEVMIRIDKESGLGTVVLSNA